MGLRLKGFGKAYGHQVRLRDIDLELPGTGRVLKKKKNGAGKTSLIKCICGLEQGDGTIGEQPEMMVVWDDAPFYEGISGYRNLMIFAAGTVENRELFRAALKMLPPEVLRRPVRTYSYGQRKKLALVLAEILSCRLIALDEISNGLDYPSALEVKERIREWSRDKCVLLTGHQYGFYNDIAERILVIKDRGIRMADEPAVEKAGRLEEIYEKELLKDHE